MNYEIIKQEFSWSWGLCSETTQALIVGVSVIITAKIVVSFILAIKRKKKVEICRAHGVLAFPNGNPCKICGTFTQDKNHV